MSATESLHRIVAAAQKHGVSKLPPADLRAFASLYREAVSELAERRAQHAPAARLAPIEALLVRAHALLYAPESVYLGDGAHELLTSLPTAVAGVRHYLVAALVMLLAGVAWGYVEVRRDPASAATMLPGSWEQNAEESFQSDANHPDGTPIRGVFYFTNNSTVAFKAYALGATAGVGTAYSMVQNGIILGATIAVVRTLASPTAFLCFVLPHSGIELFAILLAAAGGLRMGDALLRPGNKRRRDSLAMAARSTLPLAIGAAALLAVAGLVEGWVSPMPWPLAAKAAVGCTLNVALIAYLWFGNRRDRHAG